MAVNAVGKRAPVVEQINFGPWAVKSVKSHILVSEGPELQEFESDLKLPHLPEMVFAQNLLKLEHQAGFGLEFNALDALKGVDAEHDTIKVAESRDWQEARSDCEHVRSVVKPFDWTFTTDYEGTMLAKDGAELQIEETSERIDIEKLKQRDKIAFYADVILFEDELHDCGCSMLSVKIRVMPGCFFVLMRLYMRVDNVLIRVHDTRLFHEAGTNYLLRECTKRESRVEHLKVAPSLLTEPSEICDHLAVKSERYEKLVFPASVAHPGGPKECSGNAEADTEAAGS